MCIYPVWITNSPSILPFGSARAAASITAVKIWMSSRSPELSAARSQASALNKSPVCAEALISEV